MTSGGVSAGEEDHVVSAFGHHDGILDVVKVAMRPRKPVKVGLIGDMLVAGLPGNPNAALVIFRQIALPAIRSMAGLRDVNPIWQSGVAGFRYEKRLGRTEFVPVRKSGGDNLGRPILEMLERGSSTGLSTMSLADGIAALPPGVGAIEQGMPLLWALLTWRRF